MKNAFALLMFAAATTVSVLPTVASAQETAVATPAIAPGKMVFAANNQRLGAVYRVSGDSVQVIIDGKMISLPAATVSAADNGKYVTTLTKAEVMRAR